MGQSWAQGKAPLSHSQSSGLLRPWFLAPPALSAMDFNLLLSPYGDLKYCTSIWLINLHNIPEHPVKLSKGKGKGSHNFPYFTDRGECDREVVQLSSLMSCGERQNEGPRSPKKGTHSLSSQSLFCCYNFLTKDFFFFF